VLLGPDGDLIGYRKASLPPGEAAEGIAPGKDYPVFETSFGKVGMMVSLRRLSRSRPRTDQERR